MDNYTCRRAARRRFELLRPALDERLTRLWAAAEALTFPTYGISEISRITGLSRSTLRLGIEQLKAPDTEVLRLKNTRRQRKPGAGRRRSIERDRNLEADLLSLMEGSAADRSGPLIWTCKSLRQLADELAAKCHAVSYRTVGNLLHRLGFTFGRPGSYRKHTPAARRESFEHLSRRAGHFLERNEPVLSLRSMGALREPPHSQMADSMLSWWVQAGRHRCPEASGMLVIAECGASIASLGRAAETVAAGTGLKVSVAQFSPGAWRWSSGVASVSSSVVVVDDPAAPAEMRVYLDLVLPPKCSSRLKRL
jgi:transposase